MSRRRKTSSEEFNIGYETGWAHRGREEAVKRDNMQERLKAALVIMEAEMKKLKERAEAAERAQAKAEKALERATGLKVKRASPPCRRKTDLR
jgi:hypothetical protein